MKLHRIEIEQALESLHTGHEGLSDQEALRRLEEFGPNRVEEARRESLWLGFLKEFIHFFALILWFAAALAFFAESRQPGEGMATLGYAILAVILINGLFSFWQQFRAERAIAALQKLLPHSVSVLRSGVIEEVPAADIVPGDILLFQEGDAVPADCRILEGVSLRVNNATVTGEALPQPRDAQASPEEDILHARNILLAGTSVVSGKGSAVVFATGMHTEFGRIAHLTQTAVEVVSPLQREIARLSRIIAIIAVGLGVLFYLLGERMGLSFWQSAIFAIGIIVANVPEGLLPTVTLSLAMATQRMARRNALIRHLPAVETLGGATVICSDKTGTLTGNRMAVSALYLDNRTLSPAAVMEEPHLVRQQERFFQALLLCHDLRETGGANGKHTLSGDPMEVALVRVAQKALEQGPSYPRVEEIPFDTDRKRLSTIHETPDGAILYCKGALETVLPLCAMVAANGETVPISSAMRERFYNAQEEMAGKGLRVLAVAWRQQIPQEVGVEPERELVLAGLVGLEDPPRPEVPEAIARCHEAGIRVIMVTGDHPHTAVAIARQIGLVHGKPVVITGKRLRSLSEIQLRLMLDAPEIIFARVGADQKMRIVAALQKKGEIVAVTGDGVNDAPALRLADIGIAMGMTGTDVAREAADMILLDDNFASIVAAIEEGRSVFANIRRFLVYILTHNIPEGVPYLAYVLLQIPLPLTVIQILAVDLGTDILPALGLGAEKPEPEIMAVPPRPGGEHLLTRPILLRCYLFLGVIEAIAAMGAYFFVLFSGGWSWGKQLGNGDPLYMQGTGACLATIVLMQVVNVFLCKHPRQTLFAGKLLDNRLILAGVALEIILLLLVIYTPWGNALFGTAPLPASFWLFPLPFMLAMLLLEEARKRLARWNEQV